MSRARIKLGIVLVGVAGAVLLGTSRLYLRPRGALLDEVASLQREVGLYEDALRDRRGTTESLRAIAATTLGATPAEIEGRFRQALGEIGRACGLREVVPNSGTPRVVVSPAARSSLPRSFRRLLEREPDFYVVDGSLTGTGMLEEALLTLATVQSQAWAHRVGSVTIRPVGESRELVELRIDRISTMLMPDLAPAGAPDPGWAPMAAADDRRLASITGKNVFRLPPPPAAPEPEAIAEAPAPPSGPAYADWKLTGVTRGRAGLHVEMINLSTSEQVSLEVGQAVLDAQLAEIGRFSAVFRIGESLCEVGLGQTLAQRREVP